ncbi:hypothetical protein RRG08_024318 [Elysia crispata]|uniref:Uncharacterized protein n=1 Tax=Elysia crispata TaxID=231223 RepID=A0AAE1A3X1_9GAST|nr:hypothetical protein RRG08_024318 [Elysia crispata]
MHPDIGTAVQILQLVQSADCCRMSWCRMSRFTLQGGDILIRRTAPQREQLAHRHLYQSVSPTFFPA